MATLPCHPLNTLHVLGKKHAAALLESFNAQRYGGFNHTVRQLGITPKVLAERLVELEASELLIKTGDTYEITPKGKELVALFQGIKSFHFKYGETSPECMEQLCTHCEILAPEKNIMSTKKN